MMLAIGMLDNQEGGGTSRLVGVVAVQVQWRRHASASGQQTGAGKNARGKLKWNESDERQKASRNHVSVSGPVTKNYQNQKG